MTPETYAHPYLLTDIEKPDFTSQSGGVIGTKSLTVKLNIMERIVWDNLGQKLKDIFDKSKAEISDKKIDEIMLAMPSLSRTRQSEILKKLS